MNRKQILVLAMTIVWVLASWQWYTCSIKGMCALSSKRIPCSPLLSENITRMDGNTPSEVIRLQHFLNIHENAGIAENGIYGEYDMRAITRFQEKYRDTILVPANEASPTGNVYGYTRNKINKIYCEQLMTSSITNQPYSPNHNPMFNESVSRAYDFSDASAEIFLMLLGAFLLGWLFRIAFEKGFIQYLQNLLPPVQVHSPPHFTPATIPVPYSSEEDLKIIEGVGPKIEALFKAHGVKTWSNVANATPAQLKEVLMRGGDRFALADPTSWPDQAALAVEGRWKDLEDFKKVMIAGRVK